jgi:RNA polymerase sigma-70 factor (ECF subfamily)
VKGHTAVTADFDHLVETHSALIFAYLWRMLGETADAEDCLQETFLRAFRARGRLAGHANPTAWLYRIATNTARTQLRQRGRAAQHTAPLDSRLPEGRPGPAETLDRRETLDAVARAVAALPHQQRAALMLRKYQGLSYAEVGAALSCSEAAARANVYQALKKLRAELVDREKEREREKE